MSSMHRAFVALLLCACAHRAPGTEAPPLETVAVQGETVTRSYDLNGDGKPDDWKIFKLVRDPSGQVREVLVERRLDLNFDGKPDVTTWYDESGAKVREAFDLDFDGKPDVTAYYEKGELVRKEYADRIAYYESGKRVRIDY